MLRISVGIVLYNPDIDRLKENINAIIVQSEKIYIVDNLSINYLEVQELLEEYSTEKIVLIKNEKNEGIAKALNQICNASYLDGYTWCLALDQDSVCPSNIIEEYQKYINDSSIGMLCPWIYDRNKCTYNMVKREDVFEVNECITSGSMINLCAWKVTGKFDEKMFIDGVDFDICHRLRKKGYKILCIGKVVLIHELGHIEIKRFGIWNVLVKNHSATRKYYIARNTIYLARKEKRSLIKALLQNIKMLLIDLGYEQEKILKAKRILKGTIDGFTMPD